MRSNVFPPTISHHFDQAWPLARTGTFNSHQKVKRDEVERERQLGQLVSDFVARAGAAGFTIDDLLEQLRERKSGSEKTRR